MSNEYLTILRSIQVEQLKQDLVSAKIAKFEDDKIKLSFGFPSSSIHEEVTARIKKKITQANFAEVPIEITTKIEQRVCQGGVENITGVKNVIAVASAKGGVGKSFVAANLALSLKAQGVNVGLLDADIYGPSVSVIFGGEAPQINEQEKIIPLNLYGIQTLSMGHLIDPNSAMIWRGPMVIKALRQFIRDTAWSELDFLVIDLPPGTGDVQLSLAQNTPITGAIIVSTPQTLSIADAIRGISMFEKVSIPVLGYVANMTSFVCPNCNQVHEIFGKDKYQELTANNNLKCLAKLPIDQRVNDADKPFIAEFPDSELSNSFKDLAMQVGISLLDKAIDRSAKFPKIVPQQ